uniref:creatine kinase n=1 Tax=Oncorhynchus tshawytscha TaxID=74940 RepID=A0A8C8FJ91_ONCTS
MARDWHNNQENFLLWINEEDHTLIIWMEKGSDMKRVFERFYRGLKEVERLIVEKGWEFMWSKRLGYILTCPSNLGTGLRSTCLVSARSGMGGVDAAAVEVRHYQDIQIPAPISLFFKKPSCSPLITCINCTCLNSLPV